VVIVPFVRWGELARLCVDACLALDDEDFLVCLVPSGKGDVPEPWASRQGVEIIASGVHGISAKRNQAIRAHPEAELFACIDSDAWPEPQWLRNAREVFAQDPDIWAVGGPNLDPPNLPFARQVVGDALRSMLVSGPKVFTKRPSPSRDVVDLPSCNLIIRRQAVEATGGFDETMEVSEDSVLCQGVISRGKMIRFSPEVRVYHLPRAFLLPFARQRFVVGWGIPPLLRRCGRAMGPLAVAMELAPTLALAYLSLGWIPGLVNPWLWWPYLAVLGLYLGLVVVETLRVAHHPRGWLHTGVALAAGNLLPGLGTIARYLGVSLDIGEVYRNDLGAAQPPDAARR
jgi:hypothetical protein